MLRLISFSIVTLSLSAVVGCADSKETAGTFGEPEKTKNDGTVRKMEAPPAPPKFDDAMVLAPAFDKATGALTVTLKLKPGYHAYAPGEEIGKPVEMMVEGNGWALDGGVKIPAGLQKDLGDLGKSVILEGDVPLTAVVKGGTGDVTGVVTAQVCTDTACDRPRKHPFAIPTT